MKRYNSSTETTAESRKRLGRVGPDITSLVLSIFSSKKDAKLDEARMQALFNALAMLFLLVGACIAAAVYYVLKPFLHALLWAILTGTFLHPFKHRCTTQLNAWLLRLEESKVPLTFGLLLSPLYLFNWVSTSLMELVLTHWVALAGSVFGLCGLWALVALSASAYDGFEVTYGAITHLDVVLAQTRWLQVRERVRAHTHTHTHTHTHFVCTAKHGKVRQCVLWVLVVACQHTRNSHTRRIQGFAAPDSAPLAKPAARHFIDQDWREDSY